MKLNRACSVIYIWWSLTFIENTQEELAEVYFVQAKLTKASKYIAGQLFKQMGLRKPPEIRFFMDKSLAHMLNYDIELDKKMQKKNDDVTPSIFP